MPGSVVLMAGEPGVGKSTLLLQTAQGLAARGDGVVYVSGEESAHQLRLRADRLGLEGAGIHILPETDINLVLEHLESLHPAVLVVDSVQTLYQPQVASAPGSPSQVRECGLQITRWAKETATPALMAGHITKDGAVAGPMVLEHMVDVVLYLEADGTGNYRMLRSMKNRFGSTNETGFFQMGSTGLEEVPDPSWLVLSERSEGAVGSAIVPLLEGTRPLLVEVQALTSPTGLAVPRRTANGLDYNRLLMLVAVLSRRVGVNLSNQDVIVSVAGGLRVREPAADLALALAIVSSTRNMPLDPRMVALGEVGLSGELRAVPQLDRRLAEATRLGLSPCLIPSSGHQQVHHDEGPEVVPIPTLAQAIRRSLPRGRRSRPSDQDGDLLEGVVDEA